MFITRTGVSGKFSDLGLVYILFSWHASGIYHQFSSVPALVDVFTPLIWPVRRCRTLLNCLRFKLAVPRVIYKSYCDCYYRIFWPRNIVSRLCVCWLVDTWRQRLVLLHNISLIRQCLFWYGSVLAYMDQVHLRGSESALTLIRISLYVDHCQPLLESGSAFTWIRMALTGIKDAFAWIRGSLIVDQGCLFMDQVNLVPHSYVCNVFPRLLLFSRFSVYFLIDFIFKFLFISVVAPLSNFCPPQWSPSLLLTSSLASFIPLVYFLSGLCSPLMFISWVASVRH